MLLAFSTSVDVSIIVGFVAGGVVVIGIVLEGAELLVKFGSKKKYRIWIGEIFRKERRRKLVSWVKCLKPSILPVEALGFSLIVIGLTVEWISGTTAAIMQSRENGILESTNVQLSLQVEQLRQKNDANEHGLELVWEHSLPRGTMLIHKRGNSKDTNAPFFGGKLISNLKKLPKGTAKIAYVKDDSEASQFAQILAFCLHESGWSVTLTNFAQQGNGLDTVPNDSGMTFFGKFKQPPELWVIDTNWWKINFNSNSTTNSVFSGYRTDTPLESLCLSLYDCGFPISVISCNNPSDPEIEEDAIGIKIGKKHW